MRKLVSQAALVLTALAAPALAHGGTYSGPRDVVPPGGGGTGGGGGATPGTGGPSTPNGPGPHTPNGPGGPATPGGAGGIGGPSTGGGLDAGDDLARWQYWWELNKSPLLDLKRHVWEGGVTTLGSDETFFNGARKVRDQLRPSRERVQALVVPALRAALDDESADNDVVSGALIALAKIGDVRDEGGQSQLVARFGALVSHPNQEIAETAALALGLLGDDGAVELLAGLLADDRAALERAGLKLRTNVAERTRAFAAYALGFLAESAGQSTRRAIAAELAKPLALEPKSYAKRDVPVACVLAFGLIELEPASELASVERARFESPEDQVRWLLELFADARWAATVRAHAPRSLARVAMKLDAQSPLRREVLDELLARVEAKPAENATIVQSCVLALGELADCDADALDVNVRASLMRVATKHSDVQAQRFALIALAQAAGRAGQGDEPFAGLARGKDDPREFLLTRLGKGQSDERSWAALATGVLERSLRDQRGPESSDARLALRTAHADAKAPDEIGATAIALGIARDADAAEALLARLERTNDPDARGYVALALGLVGDSTAITPISEVIARSKYQPELLRSAAIALGLLGDRNAVPSLIAMLETASALSSQAALASALGTIGDARSLEPLTTLLGDQGKTGRARGFAAAALGIAADPDEHAWVSRLSVGVNYRASTETLTAPDGGTGVLQLL